MKRILHELFNNHQWESHGKEVFDWSEPHSRHGDWLPTQGRFYKCECGMKKAVYHDGLTHLGSEPDRVFIYSALYPEYKDLIK